MHDLEVDKNLERAISTLKGLRISLTDASRRPIVAESLRRRRPSVRQTLSLWLEMASFFRTPAMGPALAMVLVGLLAMLALNRSTYTYKASYGDRAIRLVSVVPVSSGGVTLEWQNGQHRVYHVQKSTDPRSFDSAESYTVRGNRWTDVSPARGEVTYYRVQ
jgi:hypothetical protein